jgi:hypothetical protein
MVVLDGYFFIILSGDKYRRVGYDAVLSDISYVATVNDINFIRY